MLVGQKAQRHPQRPQAPIEMKFCQYAVQKGVLQFWYDCAAYAVSEIDGSYFCKTHAKTILEIK
jgi:hypothetical protein